ncbi:MAG: hypothetical protein NTX91_03330 [candidate division SR1 bacterium]|nr:hypothetical protein [candidate division SR1 bacterium]
MMIQSKVSERSSLGSNIDDFKVALKTESFFNRYQELLQNFENYDGKFMNQAFSKLSNNEYLTKKEESLFEKFLNDPQVNRYVINNIEQKLKDNISLIRFSYEKMIEDIATIPTRIDNIKTNSALGFHPGIPAVDTSVINLSDKGHIMSELRKDILLDENTFDVTAHRTAVDEVVQSLSKHKTYLESRMKYTNALAECLENIVGIPYGGHIKVFKKDEEAGSLFTLRRLLNIQQATHEVTSYLKRKNKKNPSPNPQKTINETTILKDGSMLIISRNGMRMEFYAGAGAKFKQDYNKTDATLDTQLKFFQSPILGKKKQ